MTAKMAGGDCPGCADPWTAEFALAGEPPRWKCNACGLGGSLFGRFDARKPLVAPPPAPGPKPHWQNRGMP